jgi:sulfur carrier protein
MQVFVNKNKIELPDSATLADAVRAIQAQPPFAAAVNTQFVPKTAYEAHRLAPNDQVDVIFPVTGG